MTVNDILNGQYRHTFRALLINGIAKIAYDISNDNTHENYETRLDWANNANLNIDRYADSIQMYVAYYISSLYEGDISVLNQTNVNSAVSASIDKVA